MSDTRTDAAARTVELPAYKYGKALLEQARAASKTYTASFTEDKKFALGENQWPMPTSFRSWQTSKWKNQGVRNYTWAMIQHKLAVCLDAEPSIMCEPMNELSSFQQREDISSAVFHELARMRWNDYTRDVMIDGAILGKGHIHVYPVMNSFTQMYELNLELVDPQRFYPDPARTRLHECRFVVYEPELDMATIRRIFPDTYQLVKAQNRTIGKLGEVNYSRSESEIIYGPSTGEIAITREGLMADRYANVAFIYVKDNTVVEEVKTVLEKAPSLGYHCGDCGDDFEQDAAVTDYSTALPRCPGCNSGNLTRLMLPPEFAVQNEKRQLYPNGRLICLTDDALLYDGENPHPLSGTYPFAAYDHYSVTGRYWGYGDVALLKKVQQALNKNMSQAIDFMRLAGNGPLEVPAEVPAYRNLGNAPGDQVPVPAPFMGLARYLSPTGYNVQMHQIIDEALKQDMGEVSGVTDVALGVAPASPTSGIEVQTRQRAASTRLGLHLKALNDFRSDLANIVWQMMNHYYREPRAFTRIQANGELDAIVLEVNALPREVSVRVTANIDKAQKEELFGQNLMLAVKQGQVPFYPDLMLPMMGGDPIISREIQRRMQADLMAQQQAAQMMGGVVPGSPVPGDVNLPPPAAAPPPSAGDEVLQAEGGV
jgi:DNA-directed RNA polymerase subunit RPC12/RpoP